MVKYAEADFILFNTETSIPDDQFFLPGSRFEHGQWSLNSTEPYSINADLAWDKAKGGGKILAVLDDGFTSVHDDLSDIAWFYDVVDHPEPRLDFTDKRYLIIGQQYLEEQGRMIPTGDWRNADTDYENEFYHGIACSGIAAARMNNNSYGITGVAPEASIGMIRIAASYTVVRQKWDSENERWVDLGPTGEYRRGVRYSNVIEALYKAVPALTDPDNCARVINMSMGFTGQKLMLREQYDFELLQEAINHAHAFHCVIVASTGNDGLDYVTYPAKFDNVLAVGATERDGHVWELSNYGPEIDCVAPGVGVIATMPISTSAIDEVAQSFGIQAHINGQDDAYISRDGEFALRSGTSFAAAHVSGAVAVLQSFLIESEASVIEHLLKTTARNTLDPSKDGSGLIDIASALDKATIQNFTALLTDQPSGGEEVVELTWESYSEFEFDQYDIWRRTDDGVWDYYDVTDDLSTEYTDWNITPGHMYYYEVRARRCPFGSPGHCPVGFPLWMNTSICGRSQVDSVDYQGSGGCEPGEYPDAAGDIRNQIPNDMVLCPNFPNPFNPTTSIKFGLPYSSQVRLRIMNVRGETVKFLVDEELKAGWHTVRWDGRNEVGLSVASGIYLFLIETDEKKILRKMTLIR